MGAVASLNHWLRAWRGTVYSPAAAPLGGWYNREHQKSRFHPNYCVVEKFSCLHMIHMRRGENFSTPCIWANSGFFWGSWSISI